MEDQCSKKSNNIGSVGGAGEIPNLPQDIIEDILKRLPVKSLKRFTCVSKSWLSLILSPQFIKTHLKHYSPKNHRFLYTTLQNSYFDLKHSSANSLLFQDDDEALIASDIDYPMKNVPHSRARVVDSCNGVICLFLDVNSIFLWNPSSRSSKKLPRLPQQRKTNYGPHYYMWGLGFHECHGDFKAVALCCALNTRSGLFEMKAHLYSLKQAADSWKRVPGYTTGLLMDHSGKYARGKFHFTVLPGMNSESKIISVDSMSGLIATLDQPNFEDGVIGTYLGVLEGCLSVIGNHHQRGVAYVWVMQEYNVKHSWTKLFSIPFLYYPAGTSGFFPPQLYSHPLIMLPSGELLVVFGMHFVIYNPTDNTFRRPPEINNLPHGGFSAAHLYVETLLSF